MTEMKKVISTIVALLFTIALNAQVKNFEFKEAGLNLAFSLDPGTAQVIKDNQTKEVRKYLIKAKDRTNKKKVVLCAYYEGNKVYPLSVKSAGEYISDNIAEHFFGSFIKL